MLSELGASLPSSQWEREGYVAGNRTELPAWLCLTASATAPCSQAPAVLAGLMCGLSSQQKGIVVISEPALTTHPWEQVGFLLVFLPNVCLRTQSMWGMGKDAGHCLP